jgi:hypothetical protein
MKTSKHTFYPLAAVSLIATGVFSASATADIDVVAVLATQSRLANDAVLFELGADKQLLFVEYTKRMNEQLSARLVEEYESAKQSALLASDFSKQILDALDERLPDEVSNLISSVN